MTQRSIHEATIEGASSHAAKMIRHSPHTDDDDEQHARDEFERNLGEVLLREIANQHGGQLGFIPQFGQKDRYKDREKSSMSPPILSR